MSLDRALQLTLLTKLADEYPDVINIREMSLENPAVTPNLHYLAEHGLVDANQDGDISLRKFQFLHARITAAGMDFLADDGGLSAILGVVTIKLHDETIRALIEAKILASDLPVEEKAGLLSALKDLPGEALKHLTTKLLDAGLANWPTALLAIQMYLQHAPK